MAVAAATRPVGVAGRSALLRMLVIIAMAVAASAQSEESTRGEHERFSFSYSCLVLLFIDGPQGVRSFSRERAEALATPT